MASAFSYRPKLATVLGAVAATGLAVGIASKYVIKDARADSPGGPRRVFPGGPAFFSLPLESAELVNHNTRRLRFRLEGDAVTGLPLTASLLTMSWPEGRWTPVVRPYTPVSSSDEPGYVELLVKRYPGGKSSTHLHSLKQGESLFFLAALKGPKWQPNRHPHVTLIAGGAGITPVYQLLQGILRNPEDRTAVTLVYGANSDADVLLKRELDAFEKEFPGRFRAVYAVSKAAEGSPYRQGRVTRELLREVVARAGADGGVYVCGPPAMEASLLGRKGPGGRGLLQEMGYRKDQIHTF